MVPKESEDEKGSTLYNQDVGSSVRYVLMTVLSTH